MAGTLPVALYPAWDGTTPNRESLDIMISPLWPDWDRVTAELLAQQSVIVGVGDVGNGAGQIELENTSAPTVAANTFVMYASDQTAGNSAPFFKTEAGQIVKLYQQTHKADVTGGSTVDAESRAAINGLYDVLENLGLLAAS